MGGSISIAARFNDGQAICIDGWTNFLPNMIVNETTLSGDDRIVRETLMEVASLDSYEGPQPFRSYGYGMVAIDFVAREIHSMQGYTSFNRRILLQLLDQRLTGWKGLEYVSVLSKQAEGLLDAGRIKIVGRNGEECATEILDRETALAMLNADAQATMRGDAPQYVAITVDTAPFLVHDYPEGGSLAAMKKRLAAAGFPLTKTAGLNKLFKTTQN